jgi:hypothetical protein
LLFALGPGCLVSPDPSRWQSARDGEVTADRGTDHGPAFDLPPLDGPRPWDLATRDSSSKDGPPGDSAPDTTPKPDAPPVCDWTGPVKLAAPSHLAALSSTMTELEPMLSADGLTITFGSNRDGAMDIFTASRPSPGAPFGAVTKHPVSTAEVESRLSLSADGLEAFLAADWTGGPGQSDIWIATRSSTATPFAAADFQPATALSTAQDDWDPFPSANGLRLYYNAGNWPSGAGAGDLVVASRASRHGTFSAPAFLAGLNTASTERDPAVTADERVILFGSNRPGGAGSTDLYYAVRPDASSTFSAPQPVPGVNTAAHEAEVYITPDGCEIYFASTRPGGLGSWDLYHTKRIP